MILLLGLGNPAGRDEGASWEVIRRFSKKELPGVETKLCQKLGPELVEDWDSHEKVLLVDVTLDPVNLQIEPVNFADIDPQKTTSWLKAQMLMEFSKHRHGECPDIYLFQIPGKIFESGTGFSSETSGNIQEAVKMIQNWLIRAETPA